MRTNIARPHGTHSREINAALPEPLMSVLREAGVIGHFAVQSEAAEPAIGEIKVDFFAEPPFRADAHGIADDQHPHHQLGSMEGRPVVL